MPNSWYKSFDELSQTEREHLDYKRRISRRRSGFAIIAPHGGGIEPGTTELARAIAGFNYSFYSFEGIKTRGNEILHISSTLFDEPKCMELLRQADIAVAIHGCEGGEANVQIGGLHNELAARLTNALNAAGIQAVKANWNLAGQQPENICNKVRLGMGVQMELSISLRRSMFAGLNRQERLRTKPVFKTFTNAVRMALAEHSKASR